MVHLKNDILRRDAPIGPIGGHRNIGLSILLKRSERVVGGSRTVGSISSVVALALRTVAEEYSYLIKGCHVYCIGILAL